MKPNEAELEARCNAHNGAMKDQFTLVGYKALEGVIDGSMTHRRALQLLGTLRDLWLDRDGDLASRDVIKQQLGKLGLLKDTLVEHLPDSRKEYHRKRSSLATQGRRKRKYVMTNKPFSSPDIEMGHTRPAKTPSRFNSDV